MARIIAHVDLDAFFASIEERDKPRLRGRPIVVGADPLDGRGRGVVSTANYRAREYGIRSAMPITKAWQLSEAARRRGEEPAAFLDVDMERYIDESRRVMEMLAKSAATIWGGEGGGARGSAALEAASVDEAFLDLSPCGTYEKARAAAQEIKADINSREGLTASVGIGPNKLIAKIASDRDKPDGLTVVKTAEAEKFLEPLPVRAIPGVGPKAEALFLKRGMRIVRDAKRLSAAELHGMFGKWGDELYGKLRGRDGDAPLAVERAAKSVGEQETFSEDVPVATARDRKILTDALARISRDVYERFRGEGFGTFKAIAIVVRFSDFTTKTRITTLDEPAGGGGDEGRKAAIRTLEFQSLRLFMPFMDRRENPRRTAIRLLGVRVEKLK